MKRLKIFCERAFLDRFIEEYNSLSIQDLPVSSGYHNFLKLLGSKVELILDVEPEHFFGKIKSNAFYQYIADQFNQSQNTILFDSEVFKRIKDKNIDIKESIEGNELILLAEDAHRAAILQEFYEVIVISKDEIRQKIPKLFFSSSFSIKRNETQKSDFDNFVSSFILHPTRYLFLNDQYLLKKKEGKKSLLNLISLFAEKKHGFKLIISSKECYDLASVFNEFTLLFKNSLFTLFKGEIHNRLVFTNYYWGIAGHSLDFSREIANRDDFVEFKSIFNPKQENNGIAGYELYGKEIGKFYEEYNKKEQIKKSALVPYFISNHVEG